MREGVTYILASSKNGTLYIGVTSNLQKRIYEHRNCLSDGFSKQHRVCNLVYYEQFDSIKDAIYREKRLKKYKREAKIKLIEKSNLQWLDLYDSL
jgi:putative endonuclease